MTNDGALTNEASQRRIEQCNEMKHATSVISIGDKAHHAVAGSKILINEINILAFVRRMLATCWRCGSSRCGAAEWRQ